MALSGSVNWSMNAKQLIESAFGLIGVKKMEQPLQAAEMQDGLNTLNLMLKSWQAQGLHLWKEEEAVLFLNVGQPEYLIGPNGSHCCSVDDFIGTTTTSALLAGAAVVPLDDTVGMLAGDNVGIALGNGTSSIRFWTTIVTVDSLTQITVADALPADADESNSVYTYTTLLNRPLRVLSFRRKVFAQDNEVSVPTWSRDQYFNQVNKLSQGTVVNAYYSPQLTDGRVYVWQTASQATQLLRFTYEDPIEDIDNDTNDIDIPVEWLETVQYNLAARLCDTYDVPMEKVQTVGSKAALFLDNLLGFDQEMTSISVRPYAENYG
jgi:hypothetical protein